MALTLKIKYFNTFVLREEPTITSSIVASPTVDPSDNTVIGTNTNVVLTSGNNSIVQDLVVHGPGITENVTVSSISGVNLVLSSAQKIEKGVTLTFSSPTPYPTGNNVQAADKEWHIEESRIKGGFNEKTVDFGAKAFIVDKNYSRNHRANAMIYSGIFNSRTGINNTNQFSISENITKAVDSAYGSIQKLHAEDTNLLVLQENKVHNALIDKDAIFTAEGGNISTAAKVVIGQITPYLGEFGIGKNPESFAVYGFRKYFVDKDRSAVLRLSRDGITEISSYGMKSFFREHLQLSNRIQGMYDLHSKSYILNLGLEKPKVQNEQSYINNTTALAAESSSGFYLKIKSANSMILPEMNFKINGVLNLQSSVKSIQGSTITLSAPAVFVEGDRIEFIPRREFGIDLLKPVSKYKTLSFDDKVNGWTSFLTYNPNFGGSVASNFYTWNGANLYKHHSNLDKNTFYGVFQPSTVKIVSNQNPSLVKHYKTVNYEGTNNWKIISLKSPAEDEQNYNAYPIPGNITGRYSDFDGVKFAGFTPLEKKYYANVVIKDTQSITGISSLTTTGVKGFFAETVLEHEPVNNNKTTNKKKHAELFSVGFNYEQSLY